jgi:hypothetical protein
MDRQSCVGTVLARREPWDIAVIGGKKHGINHTFVQGTGGHVWDVWRHNLRDLAPRIFR